MIPECLFLFPCLFQVIFNKIPRNISQLELFLESLLFCKKWVNPYFDKPDKYIYLVLAPVPLFFPDFDFLCWLL